MMSCCVEEEDHVFCSLSRLLLSSRPFLISLYIFNRFVVTGRVSCGCRKTTHVRKRRRSSCFTATSQQLHKEVKVVAVWMQGDERPLWPHTDVAASPPCTNAIYSPSAAWNSGFLSRFSPQRYVDVLRLCARFNSSS